MDLNVTVEGNFTLRYTCCGTNCTGSYLKLHGKVKVQNKDFPWTIEASFDVTPFDCDKTPLNARR